jgi:hypothetical protein
MNTECHFIPRTLHFVSVYFLLNGTSLSCCSSLHTHSSKLARRFIIARVAVFSGITETCFRNAILRPLMIRGLVVYTFLSGVPKGNNRRQRDQANLQVTEASRGVK